MWAILAVVVSVLANGPHAIDNVKRGSKQVKCLVLTGHRCKKSSLVHN